MANYALLSDIHCHNWSAFSSIGEDGVNSRLKGILSEIIRAAVEIEKAGSKNLVFAGDLFHVRGKLEPSVLNPVRDALIDLQQQGFTMYILAGNHDLESRNSTRLTSAITALEDMQIWVINEPSYVMEINAVMIPWCESVKELLIKIKEMSEKHPGSDLIIHAPVDDVIFGLPSYGLTAEMLATFGFKRVFSGHYHNHKDFGNGVYSIGALSHQTWNDVGTKAGYLLVGEKKVVFRASRLPKFVDLSVESPDDIPLDADGNYVRVKLVDPTDKDVIQVRNALKEVGAAGLIVNEVRTKKAISRSKEIKVSGVSIQETITQYIESEKTADSEEVLKQCLEILTEIGE
jgi:DNA repair exonuclease SbcCD nuclease subunit